MSSSRGRSRVAHTMLVATLVCAATTVFAQDRAEPRYYEFFGRFEETPVRLGGNGLPELFSACTDYLRKSDVEPIDEITVEGRHFMRRTAYFDRQQVCGFVVLNARPPGPSSGELSETPLLRGSIDGIPFRLWAPREEAADAVRRFVPAAVGDIRVAKVIVDGENQPHAGSWSAEEIVVVIERHLVPSPPMQYVSHEGSRDRVWRAVRWIGRAPSTSS